MVAKIKMNEHPTVEDFSSNSIIVFSTLCDINCGGGAIYLHGLLRVFSLLAAHISCMAFVKSSPKQEHAWCYGTCLQTQALYCPYNVKWLTSSPAVK